MDINYKNKLKQYYIRKKAAYELDDITFNDLNLDDIFLKINFTQSSIGEDVLYGILRQPLLDLDEINKRHKRIKNNIDNHNSKNIKILNELPKIKNISIFEYIDRINEIDVISIKKLLIPTILMLISIIIIPFNSIIGIVALLLFYFYNSSQYFKYKAKIKPYLISISYLSKIISLGNKIEGLDIEKYKKLFFLKRAHFLLGNISGESAHGGSGNPLDVFLAFFKMGFHIDIIRFYTLVNRIIALNELIFEYIEEIGYIDAYMSLSVLLKNNQLTMPSFNEDEDFEIINGIHPLIKNPVPNSIMTKKSVLLTGSNASGKSSFLRMVGVNAVLAQTITMTYADKYNAPLLKVISSMSISDDLLKGDSYYMAEIKALKRITDLTYAKDNFKILCFVDEVLRGTNTKERIAASNYILRFLSENTLCFAATHDIELTDLLIDCFDNYHFNEIMNNDDISFDYKLKTGPADSCNAILLLKKLEFPDIIIDQARKMAES